MRNTDTPLIARTSRDRRILAAAVFLGSFILYWLTAARYPGWVDAAWILTSARNLELGVWANVHNLFNLIGFPWLRIFSGVDPHFALTMLCSLFGSLTVLFIYLTGMELTMNPPAAAAAATALTVSLSLWWHSTTIEVYTLNTVLIALFLYCIFRAYRTGKSADLYLAYFAGGLGISNHVLMGLYVFAFFAVLLPLAGRKFELRAGHYIGLILCYLAGASLYAVLFIIHWKRVYSGMSPGFGGLLDSLVKTFRYAMGGPFLESMFSSEMAAGQKLFWRANYLFLILLNFPSTAIIFISLGLPAMWKKKAYRTVVLFYITGIAAQIIWSANYFIWDMYAFSLPVYVMLGVPLAQGVDTYLKKRKNRLLAPVLLGSFLIPLVLYPSFARWPNREKSVDRYIAMHPEAERTDGLWDPAEYIFNPVKRNYDTAAIFCEGVLKTLPTSAVYWDDESKGAYPLQYYYQEIKGRRPDVEINRIFGLIMDETDAEQHARRMLSQLREGRPVYLAGIVEPEREILNRLYILLDPDISLNAVRSMSRDEFLERFPEYRIEEVPVVDDGSMVIYRLKRRR